MITLKDIRHGVLDIRSLEIPPGITSVIGPNGSGKTTLLKLLSGISLPESGTVFIDGNLPRQVETGWVNEFPDRNILFGTVVDEVASPLRFRRISCRETSELLGAVLKRVGIPHLRDRPVRELSGGEKILVALATSLIHNPQVLVLDEYDSHLDGLKARDVDRIVRQSGITYTIRCTQQAETALQSDQVVFLDQGNVQYHGTPGKVFRQLTGTPFYPISLECGPCR
jgi:energy-coupling factor transport system ATP-binding protein